MPKQYSSDFPNKNKNGTNGSAQTTSIQVANIKEKREKEGPKKKNVRFCLIATKKVGIFA